MKNIKLILLAAVSLISGLACDDDKEIATYNPANNVASTLLTPQNGSAYVLLAVDDTNNFETFTWLASDYGVDLAKVYTLQLALEGTNFASPIKLISTPELSYNIKVSALNLILTDLGLAAGASSNIEIRVKTTVANPDVDTLTSDVVNFAITPFRYSIPNLLTPITGDYVLEVDTLNEIPFEEFTWGAVNYGSGLASTYTLEIDMAGNLFANAVKVYSGKEISYTPTMSAINKLMLGLGVEPGSAADVEFRVKSNTDGKGIIISDAIPYNITTYDASNTVDVDPLYLVGDATLAGWDNANGVEIKWNNANQEYSVITDFKAGGMKILEVSGQWAPQWGDDGTNTGKLIYRPDEATTDPPQIPSPGTGSFKLRVNIANLTYSFEAQ